MDLQRVTERAALGPAAQSTILRGESVREAGCDPSRVRAVVTTDCGRGGVPINNDTRLYTAESYRDTHLALCAQARERWIGGEAGHPAGDRTWNIPLRMIGGSVREADDGSIVGVGQFAFMDTTAGRDLLTLYEDGCPVGLSLDGWARFETVQVTESTDLGRRFPRLVGRELSVRELREIVRYDAVPEAGADTYMPSPATEARLGGIEAALQRITEALAPAGRPNVEDTMPDKNSATPAPAIKTAEDLRAAHPELVKAIEAAANPLAGLSADQLRLVRAVTQVAESQDKPDVQAALKAVRESAERDGERVKELEATARESADRIAALETSLRRAENVSAVRREMGEWAKGKGPAAGRIAEAVVARAEGGGFERVEEAAAEATRLETIAREYAALAGVQIAPDTTVAGQGGKPPASAGTREATDTTPTSGEKSKPITRALNLVREAAGN